MKRIVELIKMDIERLEILKTVSNLNLPDCYVAAGFVRNMVWDHLHNYSATRLNDIDVVYYSNQGIDESACIKRLMDKHPKYEWQVKNQANMHLKNGDRPYQNTSHAMEYWPEIETAIGVMIDRRGQIKVSAPFGVESLFAGFITHNKYREIEVFETRIESKRWLDTWPKLSVRL